jgi:hypothetical protein
MSRVKDLPVLATVLGALSLAAAAAHGNEVFRDIPYRSLHDAITAVKPLEDARFIAMKHTVQVSGEDMGIEDLRMLIGASGGDIEVEIRPDGSMDFPISDALLQENPPVRVNAPAGGLSLSLTIDISAPPARRFSYGLLTEMSDEYDQMIRRQGLMARMAAPKPSGLEIRFPPGEPATAVVGGRQQATFEADEDGRLRIPPRRQWRSENPEVLLSRDPELITLALGD